MVRHMDLQLEAHCMAVVSLLGTEHRTDRLIRLLSWLVKVVASSATGRAVEDSVQEDYQRHYLHPMATHMARDEMDLAVQ